MSCNKFWLENIKSLFCDSTIVPSHTMTLESRLNAITRLVLGLGIILYLIGYKQSILFILISVLMIILGYYIKTPNMSTVQENFHIRTFSPINDSIAPRAPVTWNSLPQNAAQNYSGPPFTSLPVIKETGASGGSFYSGDSVNLQMNKNFVSQNQGLVGPPNPKTLVKPIVIDPIYDITQRASELNVPTGINKRSAQFLGDSGYYVRDSVNDFPSRSVSVFQNPVEGNKQTVEYYNNPTSNVSRKSGYASRTSTMPNNSYDYRTFGEPPVEVNTAAVYNPSHYKEFNAPNNVPISKCDMEDPEFNDRIYTQYIQPNSYNKTQVVGFPSSNIGISFQEPIYNTAIKKNPEGGNTYTELDPNSVFEPEPFEVPYKDEPTYSEMYDPRQNGYGSQKRAYLDPMTGQPRYFYKDIDATRRGNFFTRNNIDHLPFAPQTGLMRDSINLDVQSAADSAYLDQNSQFRENLQQSLMSKRNSEMWQLRKYPISRAGNRTKNLR